MRRHDIKSRSVLLPLFEENPPVTGGFPSQRASNAEILYSFDASLNKLLYQQSNNRWFQTSWR